MNKREIEDVARLYDIRAVLGLAERRRVILCPLPFHVHVNNTPSFSIDVWSDGRQRWHCHGQCGREGDVIDLVGYMHIPGYNRKNHAHLERAVNLLRGSVTPGETPPIPRKTPLSYQRLRELLPPGDTVVSYAKKRGLTEDTLKKFSIGGRKSLAIPAFENGELRAIKYRSIQEHPRLRFWMEAGSSKALFNHDAVVFTDEPVVLAKGEIPVMLLDQYDIKACAMTTGEASLLQEWKHVFSFSKRVVVIGDNDANPETDRKMKAKAQDKATLLNGLLRFPPLNYHDVDEWILSDSQAIPTILEWLNG